MDNKYVKELTDRIEILQKKYNEVQKELYDLRDELVNNCPHEDTATRDEYHEGGYLNASEYHNILYCKLCNKILDRKIEYGTYR